MSLLFWKPSNHVKNFSRFLCYSRNKMCIKGLTKINFMKLFCQLRYEFVYKIKNELIQNFGMKLYSFYFCLFLYTSNLQGLASQNNTKTLNCKIQVQNKNQKISKPYAFFNKAWTCGEHININNKTSKEKN